MTVHARPILGGDFAGSTRKGFVEDMQNFKGSQMFTLMCSITCECMVEFGALDAAVSTAPKFRFVNCPKDRVQEARVSVNLTLNDLLPSAT